MREMAPSDWRLRFGRIFFYIQMALATWFMVKAQSRLKLKDSDMCVDRCASLVGALHNCLPYLAYRRWSILGNYRVLY